MSKFPIQSPRDLQGLTLDQLEALAQEIRQKILAACLKNGGHLGASLGTVELAIALHTAFESPREPIIWDVGHQAYAHKLLTGRWDRFDTLRLPGGISGFLHREESEHDVFGAGHSSTSLSAALGMAWAEKHQAQAQGREPGWTVAVIGDGGLTAGIAFEALNNLRETVPGPLLVVLNDNQMSISRNSGAVPEILASGGADRFFEEFGLDYVGPIDGHDLGTLIGTLHGLKTGYAGRPIVLHAITQKGKGYAPAEELPAIYHGIGPVQEKTPGAAPVPKQVSFSEAFGRALSDLAEGDPRVVAITAAMKEGTGLNAYAEAHPTRFFDVGIAEPHAVTFAAGLATRGVRPVVAIYSTFLQRALDSVIHDVALQKLPVCFVIDRAGVVGADGPTHHGAFDLAYLGMIPGLHLSAPSCLSDLKLLLDRALSSSAPYAIRIPRGGAADSLSTPLQGSVRWHVRASNPEVIVVGLGTAASRIITAAQKADPAGTRVSVISSIDAKPIPSEIIEYLKAHPSAPLLTVEDGSVHGGFGESLLAGLSGRSGAWDLAGYEDHFITHGSPAGLEDAEGLSAARLASRIEKLFLAPVNRS